MNALRGIEVVELGSRVRSFGCSAHSLLESFGAICHRLPSPPWVHECSATMRRTVALLHIVCV